MIDIMKKVTQPHHRRIVILTAMVSATVVLSLILIGLLAYWHFAPYRTVEYTKDKQGNILPFETEKSVYEQGEIARYKVDYCKYTNVIPDVKKYYVDGLRLPAQETASVLMKGCHEQWVEFTIPHSLSAGKWKLEVEAVYQLNPIRTQTSRNETVWFTVVDNTHDDAELDEVEMLENHSQFIQ